MQPGLRDDMNLAQAQTTIIAKAHAPLGASYWMAIS
jgi:hypothetical protein